MERQSRWMMAMRVVTVTTLLICAFGVELLLRPVETLRPLFTLATVAYGMVLLYAVLDHWLKRTNAFLVIQLIGDALLITFFVGITGGIDSPMSFLYLLPISVASMLLYRRGGLTLAVVCWLFYAALITTGPSWYESVPANAMIFRAEPGRGVYFLVAHLVAMVAFALLSSYLSERLRAQGRELVERRGAVARLKALNENIIGSINSGLITTNLNGEINFMNRGGEEIIGLSQKSVEGREVGSLLGLEPDFLQEIRKRLLEHRRYRFERYYDTGDGKTIFLGTAVSNLRDKAGRPLGYIFIFQDLTDIHALELEVRLKERMAALGEMAAGMAHELRNPLAAISGAVQYLKGDMSSRDETLELMDIIMRESQRLDQTIKDFLTFARPGTFAPESIDLVKLIDDNIKLLRKSGEFMPGHRIRTSFPSPRVECEADPNRLKQIFWNLATNGLKSMPRGGTLTISIEQSKSTGFLELAFADEGVGMDDKQKELYFQPFSGTFREGTGLGAAIVYRLVEEHGGRIRLESSAAGGTCVRITIPQRCAVPVPEEIPRLALEAVGG
jgi:two-component system sensor histidine kinase PilS (NtrC family)